MSYPSTQSAFSSARPLSSSSSSLLSHAAAYRAAHGPRYSLPYQSSYQRDYATIDEYIARKQQREREGQQQQQLTSACHEPAAAEDEQVNEEEQEEEEGEGGSPLSDSDDNSEAEDGENELAASSTFLQTSHPELQQPSRQLELRRPASSSASPAARSPSPSAGSSAVSSPPSASSSSSPLYFHSPLQRSREQQRRITPWPAEERREGRRRLPTDDDSEWNRDSAAVQKGDERSVLSHSLSSRPQSSSWSLASVSSSPAASASSALSSPLAAASASPPSLLQPARPVRSLVGDRDSDWRPSRRMAQSSAALLSDPIAFRYLPAAAYAAPSATVSGDSSPLLPSASFSASSASPSRSSRRSSARIDPASIPFAAGVPSRALTRPSSLSSTPAALFSPSSPHSLPLSGKVAHLSDPPLHRLEGVCGRGERFVGAGGGPAAWSWKSGRADTAKSLLHTKQQQVEAAAQAQTELLLAQQEADEAERRRCVVKEERRRQRRQRESQRQRQLGAEESDGGTAEGEGAGRLRRPLTSLPAQPEPSPPTWLPSAAAASAAPPPLLTGSAVRPRALLSSSSLAASVSPFVLDYGYADMTCAAIERRRAEERAEYEAELRRIREDNSNAITRRLLRERNQGWWLHPSTV